MTYSNLGPWEDDGLTDPLSQKVDEQLLVRFDGGPFAGNHFTDRSSFDWPPPPELEMDGQRYVLVSHSQITNEHVLRGALYRFSPDDIDSHDDRAEAVESGHPIPHQRADDGEHD